MDIFIDSEETGREYRAILHRIKLLKNGQIKESMEMHGLRYNTNWGVSVVQLRQIAGEYNPSHVLALKLWNKKWRESMILATLLDSPADVTEEQMDFWTKSFENIEIAEQAVSNLWVKTPFAFVKALEWCRGKKHLVRVTGILLIGRLALIDRDATDEMFEIYFEEFMTLAKDSRLIMFLLRTLIHLANRSMILKKQVNEFAELLGNTDSETARKLGAAIFEEVTG